MNKHIKTISAVVLSMMLIGTTVITVPAFAENRISKNRSVQAYNINIDGNEYLKDGYVSKTEWYNEKQRIINEINSLLSNLATVKNYVDNYEQYSTIDVNNYSTISDLSNVKTDIETVYNSAKQKEQEALAAKKKQLELSQQNPNNQQESAETVVNLPNLYSAGVVNWGGYRFTWYSQRVLPGTGLNIPGRHVNEFGFVCDADGYIVAATAFGRGTVGNSPWGAWKSYDTGVSGNTVDLYCNW